MSTRSRDRLRAVILMMILALIVGPAIGTTIVEADCSEPCPDEADTGCQPLCAACTVCAHVQLAVTTGSTPGLPFPERRAARSFDLPPPDSGPPSEILHVPLLG